VKHPVPTLAALALVGAVAPATYGASIKDDTMSLTFKNNVQIRGTLPMSAQDDAGNDWDIFRGAAGDSEPIRFEARRVRIGLEAKYGDWKGKVTIRAEKNDTAGAATSVTVAGNGNGNTYAGNNRAVALYYAAIERGFKVGDGMDFSIRAGLDKSFNIESVISSSTFLFPSDSVVDERVEERNLGVGLMFKAPVFHLGVDLHNNSTATTGAAGTQSSDNTTVAGDGVDANGLFYSARVQTSFLAEWMPAKMVQSFCGKEGTHLVVGLDLQKDADAISAIAATGYRLSDTLTWGPDVLFHWNGLTAFAEYRMRTTTREDVADATNVRTDPGDLKGRFWNIQAAFALPVEDIFVEPAIRYSVVDSDTNTTAAANPYNVGAAGGFMDNGGDGRTIDVGVNLYFNGHDNKIQVAFQSWKAEEGNGKANIIRIQQQLNF
jgi:hypothetical protein